MAWEGASNIGPTLLSCQAPLHGRLPNADHLPIHTNLDFNLLYSDSEPRPNFRATNWEDLNAMLATELLAAGLTPETEILTTDDYDRFYHLLTTTIQKCIAEHVPKPKISPYSKRWWTRELTDMKRMVNKASRKHFKYPTPENRTQLHSLSAQYTKMMDKAKAQHWKAWLEDADEKSIWIAGRYASKPFSDGCADKIPALKREDGTLTNDNKEKCDILYKTFFPPAPPADNLQIPANPTYPDPVPMPEITYQFFSESLMQAKPFSAPGPDGIPNVLLQQCFTLVGPLLWTMFNATRILKYEPSEMKQLTTIVLRKPGRDDYSLAKSYRPIALYRTIKKSFDSVYAKILAYVTETHQLLPPNHIGGRPGRTTSDAIHLLTSRIKDELRKGNVVTVISLDIQAAFPNAVKDRLIHNMKQRRVPTELVDYFDHDLAGQSTCLTFDDYSSPPYHIDNGIGQGAPSSGGVYHFYNAPLIEIITDPHKSDAAAYFDDTWLLTAGKTFEDCDELMDPIAQRAQHWSETHNSPFEVSKFAMLRVFAKGKQIERTPFSWIGKPLLPSPYLKYLGVYIDQDLNFKIQAESATNKALKVLYACYRLTRPAFGLPHKYIRRLYTAIVIPKLTYALDTWYRPVTFTSPGQRNVGNVGFLRQMGKVHRLACLLITGGLRATATDVLEVHANLPPLHLQLNRICHNAALRLCALPNSHPIYPVVSKASRFRSIRRHRSPLHNLMQTWNLVPDAFETIVPFPFPPTWTPPFTTLISPSRLEAKDTLLTHDPTQVVFSDGSGLEGDIGGACHSTRLNTEPNLLLHLGPAHQHTVFEGELVGAILALHSIRPTRRAQAVTIAMDNQAAIRALAKPGRKPGQHLIVTFHRLLNRLLSKSPRLSVRLTWIPGHANIPGNEKADENAREAAVGESSPPNKLPSALRKALPHSLSAAKSHQNLLLHEEWHRLWKSSPRWTRLQQIDKSTPFRQTHRCVNTLSRRNSSLIVQFRTQKVALNSFLHKIGQHDNGLCETCHTPEDVNHFFFFCSRFTHQRELLKSSLGRHSNSLHYLLSSPKGIKHALTFIHNTRRFPAYHDVVPSDDPPDDPPDVAG
jgi:ribonuclease HI